MSEPMGSDPFLGLPSPDRAEALAVAAERSGRPASILEKDVWVVFCLAALFDSNQGAHLSFKGGTSLSKAHGIIARFSEDVDLTYDVRCLLPEIATGIGAEALPPSRSQEQRWSRLVRARLPDWVEQVALPRVSGRIHTRDDSGAWIDYSEAVEGGMRLVPDGRPLLALADDYQRMLEAGLLEIDAPTFEEVIARCRALEERANG